MDEITQLHKSFVQMALENVGAGVGAGLAVASGQLLVLGQWGPAWLPLGVGGLVSGILCAYRWGSDEAGVCYAHVRNRLDVSGFEQDIRVLLHEIEKRDQQIAALKARVSKQGKPTTTPTPPRKAQSGHPPFVWVDTIYQDHDKPGDAPSDDSDDDTQNSVGCAHKLLDHHATFGTLSKHSAYEKSKISHADWRTGIDFLILVGAVQKSGRGYVMTVDETEADTLIDGIVEDRKVKKQTMGLHVVA